MFLIAAKTKPRRLPIAREDAEKNGDGGGGKESRGQPRQVKSHSDCAGSNLLPKFDSPWVAEGCNYVGTFALSDPAKAMRWIIFLMQFSLASYFVIGNMKYFNSWENCVIFNSIVLLIHEKVVIVIVMVHSLSWRRTAEGVGWIRWIKRSERSHSTRKTPAAG